MAQTASVDQNLFALFEWFHRHPELGFEEIQTTARIKEELAGMPGVELLELGLPTGALARVAGDPLGPVVAFRSDIDALPITEDSGVAYASEHPGCMHACGHDYHITSLLGAARLLSASRESLPGTAVLLFQPSEEQGMGAARVMATGALQRLGIRQMFGLHTQVGAPAGTVLLKKGPLQASVDRFVITVHGRGCHAAHPDRGLDPIVAAAQLVVELQQIASRFTSPLDPVVVSVCRMEAGATWNVIPSQAQLEGTVRTFGEAVRASVNKQIGIRCRMLQELGYTVDLAWSDGTDAVVNPNDLIDLVHDVARELGLPVVAGSTTMGGEDFSEYARLCPSCFFKVGVGDGACGHSPQFRVDPSGLPQTARLTAELLREAMGRLASPDKGAGSLPGLG